MGAPPKASVQISFLLVSKTLCAAPFCQPREALPGSALWEISWTQPLVTALQSQHEKQPGAVLSPVPHLATGTQQAVLVLATVSVWAGRQEESTCRGALWELSVLRTS